MTPRSPHRLRRFARVLLTMLPLGLLACADDNPTVPPSAFQTQPDVEPDAGPADGGGSDTSVSDTGGGSDTQVADSGGRDSGAQDTGRDFDLPDVPEPESWERGSWIIGRSVEERPIIAEHYGTEGPVLMLMGGIHGNERSSITMGEWIRPDLQGGLAERSGIRVVFIGTANPDGAAISKRHNANDVDLNRNWPADNFDPTGTGGAYPLSEPETVALRATVDSVDPSAVISGHCCVPILDHDGPGGQELAQAMANAMDPSVRFPVDRLGSRPGSMGSYVGLELGLPIITLEYAVAEIHDPIDQLLNVENALEAAVAWVAANGHVPAAEVGAIPDPAGNLESFVLAESAGGLPIRVETLLQGEGGPVMLLSGLVDNDPRSLNVAEHIRRELYNTVFDVPLIVLTAANPDGIVSESRLNTSGQAVADDLTSGALASPEAEALDALLDSQEPRLVVNLRADASADGVATAGLSSRIVEGAIPDRLIDRGTATGALADYFASKGAAFVDIGVHEVYGRGDNRNDDFFPDIDPGFFSVFVRRVIKPDEESCTADGFCDSLCDADPDCECSCDYFTDVCEAAEENTDETCTCDPDCAGRLEACRLDDHCDSYCPVDVDPDCDCSCDYFTDICEAAEDGSSETCRCDLDCQSGETACSDDDHCDSWCPSGTDPDC